MIEDSHIENDLRHVKELDDSLDNNLTETLNHNQSFDKTLNEMNKLLYEHKNMCNQKSKYFTKNVQKLRK